MIKKNLHEWLSVGVRREVQLVYTKFSATWGEGDGGIAKQMSNDTKVFQTHNIIASTIETRIRPWWDDKFTWMMWREFHSQNQMLKVPQILALGRLGYHTAFHRNSAKLDPMP